ncbi:hypothetical protein ENUP19_0361G0054 [Entamoeba nuttalli]|uniref:Uncharacterized protein n=2 Tax=Entamoeba nuttalli TaxID=412467 RepID=K2G3V6_ENTNP|nr:hypothetical protein ENU1_213400 [Entamoeba nuttalli P19]EKE36976.1 hypothetical protein ENU1_213400 [Entamoeba nuttalli P19]|eukprot:XP_008860688.1 hypothetical protein ENU1_213400 [Entamoeba nuttalli P19]
MKSIIFVFFIIYCLGQSAKQLKNKQRNSIGRNPDSLRKEKGNKKSIGKEKIIEQKKSVPQVAMSFSREELFDKSPHELSNAYVRIYQALGEVMRMSHQYNVIDSENQRGVGYISHMLGHIAQQSNKELDSQITSVILNKIKSHEEETQSIQSMTNEVSTYAQSAANKVAKFELKMKEAQNIKSTPTFIYVIAFLLQILTGYFIYIIISKRKIHL